MIYRSVARCVRERKKLWRNSKAEATTVASVWSQARVSFVRKVTEAQKSKVPELRAGLQTCPNVFSTRSDVKGQALTSVSVSNVKTGFCWKDYVSLRFEDIFATLCDKTFRCSFTWVNRLFLDCLCPFSSNAFFFFFLGMISPLMSCLLSQCR